MRFLLVALVTLLVLGLVVGAYAWQDNDNSQQQGQAQGQLQGQLQGQAQGQGQIAAQGQGQLGVVKTETSVDGDDVKTKVYANSWPALSGGEGVSQANAYSVFGGLGLSQTEAYKAYITQIQAIEASSVLSAEKKAEYVAILAEKMIKTNRTKRLLGIGPEVSGRNLLNLFGLLSWDSVWADNQKPFQSKGDIK